MDIFALIIKSLIDTKRKETKHITMRFHNNKYTITSINRHFIVTRNRQKVTAVEPMLY